MSVDLTTDDLRQAVWFAAAEAYSQGYILPDEERAFLNHLAGTGRQFLMHRGAFPHVQIRAVPSDGGIANVTIFAVLRGVETELLQEIIPAP